MLRLLLDTMIYDELKRSPQVREQLAQAVASGSVEVVVTAGIYLAAGGVFAGITFGMFETLGVSIPETM